MGMDKKQHKPIRIDRTGEVRLGDADLRVWEEPGQPCGNGSEWDRAFKRDVFARIVQTLNRLGWRCVVPGDYVARYSQKFAENFRYCTLGDLKADLRICGRCIELQFFQNVNAPDRPDHEGRYQFDQSKHMPYLLRLRMEKARRRICAYLCNVFTGYKVKPEPLKVGPGGVTALEWIEHDTRNCWHYDAATGRRTGEDQPYNNRSAEGRQVRHGQRVFFYGFDGRLRTGVAHYNINNMWWVVSGRYEWHNKASFDLLTTCPGNPRDKDPIRREKALRRELDSAVARMNFERAALIRDLLRLPIAPEIHQTNAAAEEAA